MPESSPTAAPEVVTLGEIMGLLLATEDAPLSTADYFGLATAGAESNVAIGLCRLGHSAAFVGRVGADVFGERIRRKLRYEGVDVSHLLDVPAPTGLLIRDSAQGRPITVLYRRTGSAGSTLAVSDVPDALVRQARVLYVTGITAALSESAHAATLHAMTVAHQSGVTVCFDPNVRLHLASPARWSAMVDQLARYADMVFTGADEAQIISPGEDPATWYASRGAQTVVVKDGANGATEHSGGITTHEGVRTVFSVDPVGAGDAFNTGWLSAWLRGLPVADRLREGAAVASLVVAIRGDTAGLPDTATRDAILASGLDINR